MIATLAAAGVPEAYEAPWLIALIAGAVVLVVVVVLLARLLEAVTEVDERVRDVWEAATEVASNTATTWQLTETAEVLEDVADEARLHDQLFAELVDDHS